jgi:methionyl-tRNA formyltransferase
MGGRLLVRTLERLEQGDLEPRPQDSAAATYAPRLTREDGRVDWTRPAAEIAARLRAFTPWPGQVTMLTGEPVKLVRAEVLQESTEAVPGTFLGMRDGRLAIACGDGTVLGLTELQRPGRKPLRGADFANGERLTAGALFS